MLVVLLCDECASGYAGFAESVEGRDRGEEEEGGGRGEDPTFCGVDEVAVQVDEVCMEGFQGCEVLQDRRREVWRCL